MKGAKIFLVDDSGELTPMTETAYGREVDLQELLASYPDLIPGDQINSEEPRRWLLVAREQSVPSKENETGQLSLDHLFLDQDGVPTFVLSIPIRYMHTPVELVALKDIQRVGRLLAEFILKLEPEFMSTLTWDE